MMRGLISGRRVNCLTILIILKKRKLKVVVDDFVERSDIIIANRLENELRDASDIVYTRDLFARD